MVVLEPSNVVPVTNMSAVGNGWVKDDAQVRNESMTQHEAALIAHCSHEEAREALVPTDSIMGMGICTLYLIDESQ